MVAANIVSARVSVWQSIFVYTWIPPFRVAGNVLGGECDSKAHEPQPELYTSAAKLQKNLKLFTCMDALTGIALVPIHRRKCGRPWNAWISRRRRISEPWFRMRS